MAKLRNFLRIIRGFRLKLRDFVEICHLLQDDLNITRTQCSLSQALIRAMIAGTGDRTNLKFTETIQRGCSPLAHTPEKELERHTHHSEATEGASWSLSRR